VKCARDEAGDTAPTMIGLVQVSVVYFQQMRIMSNGKNIRNLYVAIKR